MREPDGRGNEGAISSGVFGDLAAALGVELSCVLVGVVGVANLGAFALSGAALAGDVDGVVCRNGDGEVGVESGRRNGEPRVGEEP